MLNRTYKKSSDRRGAAVVEFALIAPLFFIFVFGTIEFGRMVMVQQQITAAARDGARMAIIDGTTTEQVTENIEQHLANNGVADATVSLTATRLAGIEHGTPITVTVSVSFDDVSWIPAPFFLGGAELTAAATMRKESLH